MRIIFDHVVESVSRSVRRRSPVSEVSCLPTRYTLRGPVSAAAVSCLNALADGAEGLHFSAI